MARIALSVSSDYLPNWGAYEGLRELVQNYIDAADDCGTKGEIVWDGGTARGTVRLINRNAFPLTREALLFGVTSKAHREDQRGQFGEGMKVGTLALVRAGRSVTIRTQSETWSAHLSSSAEFGGRKVLTFDTRKRSNLSTSVEVEIGPVERTEWDQIRSSFLFMQAEDGEIDLTSGYGGAILRGDAHKDAVFAKGIFVKKIEGCRWGYDLSDLTLNRDRSMVDEGDVRYRIVSLISDQYRNGHVSILDVLSLFDNNNWEAQSGYTWSYQPVIGDVIRHLAEPHKGARGLIFTASEDEAVKAESFGWSAVRIPKALREAADVYLTHPNREAFRKELGISTFSEMMDQMRDAVEHEWAREDLTSEERDNLEWSEGRLMEAGISVRASVVKFVRDGELMGLFRGGSIYIARSVLTDRMETLGTLIHEYSHNWGGDGSIAHTQAIEGSWVKVARVIVG